MRMTSGKQEVGGFIMIMRIIKSKHTLLVCFATIQTSYFLPF